VVPQLLDASIDETIGKRAMNTRTMLGWGIGMLVLLLASQCAQAQAVYKCGRGTTYTDVPCGRALADSPKRVSKRYEVPPQDRAVAARRAQLAPEERQECVGLDATMREQNALLQEKGESNVPEIDSALVKNKMRYRKLGC
jgi:hypothetical protein